NSCKCGARCKAHQAIIQVAPAALDAQIALSFDRSGPHRLERGDLTLKQRVIIALACRDDAARRDGVQRIGVHQGSLMSRGLMWRSSITRRCSSAWRYAAFIPSLQPWSR